MADARPETREGETFPLGLSPSAKAHRYETLDSLRGICAILVCLFHAQANGPITPLPFIRGSWLFVDFFFVLSGFVIAANYRTRLMQGGFFRGFVILRFGRVYPLHLVMLLAFVAMEVVGAVLASRGVMSRTPFDAQHSGFAIFTNLTLTQAFGLHDELTWNQPSWSIAVEFWTYLLFALLARGAGQALEKWLVVAVVISIAVLSWVTPNGINVTYSWGLARCVYGFAIGAIAWRLWDRSGRVPALPYDYATLIEAFAVAAVIAFVTLGAKAPANLMAPLVFGAAVLVFARAGGRISRFLLTSSLKHLGVLSFSIYMTHTFVQARFEDALRIFGKILHVDLMGTVITATGRSIEVIGPTPAQGVVLTLVMLGVVIGVSQLTWRFVELPGQRLARRAAKAA